MSITNPIDKSNLSLGGSSRGIHRFILFFLPYFLSPSPSLLFSIAMERSAEPDAKGKIRVTPRNDTGTVHRRENNIRFAPRPDFAIQKESAHIISSWTIARVLVKLYVYTCVCIKKKNNRNSREKILFSRGGKIGNDGRKLRCNFNRTTSFRIHSRKSQSIPR